MAKTQKREPAEPLVARMVASGMSRVAAEVMHRRLPSAVRTTLAETPDDEFFAKLQRVRELVSATIVSVQLQAIADVDAVVNAATNEPDVKANVEPATESALQGETEVESTEPVPDEQGTVNNPPNGDG